MNILDPLSGNTVVIDLAKEREKRRPSFATQAKNRGALIAEAFRRQNERLPKPVPVLDKEWDDEAMQPVDTVIIDRDPGDERQSNEIE